ncbi:MAG: 50S ribosomal protein L6 [Proteobacteria bacterium]|nr:50S ribosomal protein L6 [Pseudomonadota bacterium]
MVSRVAKVPINIPKGTEVHISGRNLTVKGKLGEIHHQFHSLVQVKLIDNVLQIGPANDSGQANAIAGTTRALTQNMVKGVSSGFERKLLLVGVGYRAKVQGNSLSLSLGFSHPVDFELPNGVTAETPAPTEIILKGVDKQLVSQVAANIRSIRPPEPYKGKGVRYSDEVIILKEVKKK